MKNIFKSFSVLFGLAALSFTACSKDNINISSVVLDSSEEYMVVGDSLSLLAALLPSDASDKNIKWSSSDEKVATVEDGKVFALSSGTAIIAASSQNGLKSDDCSITVGDMYVSGTLGSTSEENHAVYWKNGEEFTLEEKYEEFDPNSRTTAISVDGTDVYVSGDIFISEIYNSCSQAAVWKNGIITELPQSSSDFGFATSVCVSGGNVYVSGYYSISTYVPTLWINNVETPLMYNSERKGRPYSVFVSGTTVYVAGSRSRAILWKDGVATSRLSENKWVSYGYSVFVSGEDEYVAGYEKNDGMYRALLWKNGERTDLTDGTHNAKAFSVCSADGNAYVAGCQYTDAQTVAMLWVNGEPVILSGDESSACAVSSCVFGDKVYVAGYANAIYGKSACVWTFSRTLGKLMGVRVLNSNASATGIVVK